MAVSGKKKVTRLRKYLNGVPTNETKKNVEGDLDYIAPYTDTESCPVKAEDTTSTTTTSTTTTSTTTDGQGVVPTCLAVQGQGDLENAVQVVGGRYYLSSGSSQYAQYQLNIGTYVLKYIPSTHPIAILDSAEPNVSWTGTYAAGTKVASDGNSYTYYYGDVTITVSAAFTTALSYECYNHGYMGGQNNLVYNASCNNSTTTTSTTTNKLGNLKEIRLHKTTHTFAGQNITAEAKQTLCELTDTGHNANRYDTYRYVGTGDIPAAGDFLVGTPTTPLQSQLKDPRGNPFTNTYTLFKLFSEQKLMLVRNTDGLVIYVKPCPNNSQEEATHTIYLSGGKRKLNDFCNINVSVNLNCSVTGRVLEGQTVFYYNRPYKQYYPTYFIYNMDTPSQFDGYNETVFNWVRINTSGVIEATRTKKYGSVDNEVLIENI